MLCSVAIECLQSYKWQRILHYFGGHKVPTIVKLIWEKGLKASCAGIAEFWQSFRKPAPSGGGLDLVGHPRYNVTAEIKRIIEEQMRLDDETTAHYVAIQVADKQRLQDQSLYLLWCRTSLGWTFRGISYWQLIHHPNKLKRFEWATLRITIQQWGLWKRYIHEWVHVTTGEPLKIPLPQAGRTTKVKTNVTVCSLAFNHASVLQSGGSWALHAVTWFSLSCSMENSAIM